MYKIAIGNDPAKEPGGDYAHEKNIIAYKESEETVIESLGFALTLGKSFSVVILPDDEIDVAGIEELEGGDINGI